MRSFHIRFLSLDFVLSHIVLLPMIAPPLNRSFPWPLLPLTIAPSPNRYFLCYAPSLGRSFFIILLIRVFSLIAIL